MKPITSAAAKQPEHVLQVESLLLGAMAPSPAQSRAPQVVCASPVLARHMDQSWMRAELARQAGLALGASERLPETAAVPLDVTARHAMEVGSSGSGKSRLAEYLITQHLQAGHSVVMLEPTTQALRRIVRRAQAQGLPPEQVTILSPRLAAVPGFNPLRTELPLAQAAGDLVAMLERSTAGGGPRLADVLMNALIVIGAHRLSLYELARFLQSEEYRTRLLRLPPGETSLTYAEAHTYFQEEFAAWSKSDRTGAVAPVLRRFRELLRNDFLRAVLCAKRQTLDLASLWQRPGLVLVHLDRTSLGEDGTRLLGGLIAQLLLRTAPRAKGPVPVLLVLDELATVEHFIGSTIADIVTTARQHGLRLLMACQHLTQLSPALQASLLGNTALQAFFRLGPADVRLVAQTLALSTPVRLTRLTVEAPPPDRTTGLTAQTLRRHVIRDGWGRPLRLSPALWERLLRQDLIAPALGQKTTPLQLLRRLAPEAGRLYVEAPDSGAAVEIGQYVRALKPMEYWLDGPAPLTLVVSFPKVQVSGVERLTAADAARAWARTLQELPVQHAAIRVEGKALGVVKVATVPDLAPQPGDPAFIAAVKAHSQSAAEIAGTIAWRQAGVAQVTQGRAAVNNAPHRAAGTTSTGSTNRRTSHDIHTPPRADDGSLR